MGYVVWNWLCCKIASVPCTGQMFRENYFTVLLDAFEGSSEVPLLGHSSCEFSDRTVPLLPCTSFPGVWFYMSYRVFSRKCPWTGLPIALERALCALCTIPCVPGVLTHHLNPQYRGVYLLPRHSNLFSSSHKVAPSQASPALKISWVAVGPQFWVFQNDEHRF